ncbi:thioredoxin family protein [Thalassorhabdus alkalitolerans]|uniref:Thioredoxin family protein n=1 Tax=Thalassorhabdus alkalitolerans TaxID=2282697 RepID=A0ABW0YMI4_9BACI
MRVLCRFFIIVILLGLSACVSFSEAETSPPYSLNENEKITLFFSDENNLEKESPYYDALLTLQNNFDDQKVIIINSSEEKLVNSFDIQEFPTLLIIKGEEVKGSLSGFQNYEQIEAFLQEVILPSNERF